MSLPLSDAFKSWHTKRAAGIIKRAEALTEEYIKKGFNDSGPTRKAAFHQVLSAVDETGRDAWQAGREAALEEAAKFIESGSFLHDQSPAKLFAEQLAPKIRGLK